MSDVIIAGIGQIPVGEHWDLPLHTLSTRAVRAAIADSGGLKPQAMYIGNFLASVLSHQSNLGALLSEHAGLTGIEAYTAEAAGASGAAALRVGYLAIASGYVDTAVVVGVEKWTDVIGPELETAAALSTDYDYEAIVGMTPTTQAGLLMQRYIHDYCVPREAFGAFPLLAHANAVNNPNALYRKAIRRETYDQAELTSDPLNMFDSSPYVDGAAAVVLTRADLLPAGFKYPKIRISGSSVCIDTMALHDRPDPLAFEAAARSVQSACRQAGMLPGDADFFELCDSYSIYAVLALEAAGFARRGTAWQMGMDGSLGLKGTLPILTMGGQKARGNPLGASGIYQVVEAVQQLRGQAGANQLDNPKRALIQSLGGPASTAITHVLERL